VQLAVASIGERVPRGDFDARVHSVFTHACNFEGDAGWLGVGLSPSCEGPTALRLAPGGGVDDLRGWFDVGERVARRGGVVRAARLVLVLSGAATWRPRRRRALLERETIAARLAAARSRLRAHGLASVLADGAAADALARASRARDVGASLAAIDRLVGWGEGLTPAGDDCLVGWLAGLHRLAGARDAYRDAVAHAVAARSARTTPFAAHWLRLAAAGDFSEPVDRACDALLFAPQPDELPPALDSLLGLGATSGADTLHGLLAAPDPWGAP
jgi:hypothetical protein